MPTMFRPPGGFSAFSRFPGQLGAPPPVMPRPGTTGGLPPGLGGRGPRPLIQTPGPPPFDPYAAQNSLFALLGGFDVTQGRDLLSQPPLRPRPVSPFGDVGRRTYPRPPGPMAEPNTPPISLPPRSQIIGGSYDGSNFLLNGTYGGLPMANAAGQPVMPQPPLTGQGRYDTPVPGPSMLQSLEGLNPNALGNRAELGMQAGGPAGVGGFWNPTGNPNLPGTATTIQQLQQWLQGMGGQTPSPLPGPRPLGTGLNQKPHRPSPAPTPNPAPAPPLRFTVAPNQQQWLQGIGGQTPSPAPAAEPSPAASPATNATGQTGGAGLAGPFDGGWSLPNVVGAPTISASPAFGMFPSFLQLFGENR